VARAPVTQLPIRRRPLGHVLVAAATKIKLDDRKAAQAQAVRRQEWQDEAWDYFDDVPQVKFGMRFTGNAMAKLRIFPAVLTYGDPEGSPIPVSDPRSGISPQLARAALDEIARLKSPIGGTPELLRMLDLNLGIAGECYLVGYGERIASDGTVTPEQWDIKSVSEVTVVGGEYKIRESPSGTAASNRTLDPALDTIIRIWQRHPRFSALPDCNMRGVLGECEALLLLSNQVKAEAKSRQSAGAFTAPNELSYGPDVETEPEDGQEGSDDPFIDELMQALTDPVDDPSSAASVMPMVIRGPAEFLKPEYLRRIDFGRDTTDALDKRIEQRIEHIAQGLDLPVEVIKGHQQTTYSNATQVDEDTFEDHLEPRCVLICDAVTSTFLQPNLLDVGFAPADVARIICWYDPSALIGKTDPKESADYGLEHGAISQEAWRNRKGFDEDDKPDVDEMLVGMVRKTRQIDPGIFEAIIKLVKPDLIVEEPVPGNTNAPAAQSLVASAQSVYASRAAGRQLMEIDRELRLRLQAAASTALDKALVRAGNRIKGKAGIVREAVAAVHPLRAAAALGPQTLAAAGLTDDVLIGDEAWVLLGEQFDRWVADAQARALRVVAKLMTLPDERRAAIEMRQADHRAEGWAWMRDSLQKLAAHRLYGPDPHEPVGGEFDPTVSVPAGLVRQALAVAGGANSIETVRAAAAPPDAIYVGVSNGQAIGGVATGDLVQDTLAGGGVGVEGYEWVYGPAYRKSPFEPHEQLDGVQFTNFDDEQLAVAGTDGDWIPFDYFMPGDHDGCQCDFIPTLIAGEDPASIATADSGAALDALNAADAAEQQAAAGGAMSPNETIQLGNKVTRDRFDGLLSKLGDIVYTHPADVRDTKAIYGYAKENLNIKTRIVETMPKKGAGALGYFDVTGFQSSIVVKDLGEVATTEVQQMRGLFEHPRELEQFTVLHEIGHASDYDVVTRIFLSEFTENDLRLGKISQDVADAILDFRKAARESDAVKSIRLLGMSESHVTYLSMMSEVWARAYAQWAATEIGGDAALGLAETILHKPSIVQWTEADFAPLKAAIEKVLQARGLLK